MTHRLAFYWQPGCTSCLRTKEFLLERGIEFDSFNVLGDRAAFETLVQRGLRSVPVLLQGDRHCLAQDIEEVAAFVGVDLQRVRLSIPALLVRLEALLSATGQLAHHLAPAELETKVAGRERTQLDLVYHVPMIVRGFLDAASGGELTYAYYERTPTDPDRTLAAVLATLESTQKALSDWRASARPNDLQPDRPLNTYFGSRPLWTVLERTTWHVAQHCRQLASLTTGDASQTLLDDSLLTGLPLPRAIWDREIQIA